MIEISQHNVPQWVSQSERRRNRYTDDDLQHPPEEIPKLRLMRAMT